MKQCHKKAQKAQKIKRNSLVPFVPFLWLTSSLWQ
jgi:hypothetical protein